MPPSRANKHQPNTNLPFHYIPGPVFTQPATAAIYVTDLAWPAQRVLGGGYPIEQFIHPTQPPPFIVPKAVTLQGIGIQNGQYATAQLTDIDGTYLAGEDKIYDDFSEPSDYMG